MLRHYKSLSERLRYKGTKLHNRAVYLAGLDKCNTGLETGRATVGYFKLFSPTLALLISGGGERGARTKVGYFKILFSYDGCHSQEEVRRGEVE